MAQEKSDMYLKKPKSAYIHFCNENRDSIKAENSDLTSKQILSKLGELWQDIKKDGGDELKKYNDMAKEDKENFEKLKSENPDATVKPRKSKKVKDDSSVEEDGKTKTKKTKKKKEVETTTEEKKPRKLNGYMKYLQANREGYKNENPSLSSKQITSELAKAWKNLSEEEKLTWKEN